MGNNTLDAAGFPWIREIVGGIETRGFCELCGATRDEPRGAVSATLERRRGSAWPDVLGSGDYPLLVVSGRVLEAWDEEKIGRFPVQPVSFTGEMPTKLRQKPPPEYFWLDGRKTLGARLDFEASGFVGTTFCSECGTRRDDVAATYDLQHAGTWPYRFIDDSWNGEDVFTTDLSPTVFFCSRRVVDCAAKYKLTNFRFVPASVAASSMEGIEY